MTDVVAMTVAAWSRALIRRCRTALLTATMMTAVASLSGCSIPAGSIPANAGVSEPIAMPGMAVVLRFGDDTAAASLADTPPGRQLASMLPLTLQLQDVLGAGEIGPAAADAQH